MKRVNVSQEVLSGVNITPVIGVTLVLLVILIVMSPVMNLPNLDVDLPEAMTKETKDQNFTVSLGSDGRVSLDMEIVEWKNISRKLRAALKDKGNDTVVIVRADKNLPYGSVEKLVKIVNRSVGRRSVALATKQRVEQLGVQQ